MVRAREPRLRDPCPCGSGKRYEDCCLESDDAFSARLSNSERGLFLDTWFGLLSYVERTKIVTGKAIRTVSRNTATPEQIFMLRNELLKEPNLIDRYVKFGSRELMPEKINLLKSWRRLHRIVKFVVLRYLKKYAVLIGTSEDDQDTLYGVYGVSHPLSHMIRQDIPANIVTVLLPFKGKIICAGFLQISDVSSCGGIRRRLRERYSALRKGIVTSFD
jgi:hypothetical protein